MKRIFTFGLMLASVFALTNCTEELVDPTIPKDEVTQETTTPEGEGIPFQVYASLGTETKTEGYSDGGVLKTRWVAGDKISVFYAKVTDGVEGALTPAPTMFEITEDNLTQTMFTGQVGTDFDENATYNWYFVYDATKNATATISEDGAVTVTIGSPSQIQVSINDNSHIGSATNCPMWGTAKNISGKMKPRVQMKHLASLVAISVKNDGFGGDIKIKDVEFSVPEVIETDLNGKPVTDAEGNVNIIQEAFPIVGEFQFNILDGNFKAVTSGSSTSKVELQSAYHLPKENGNTATFYLAIRPFKETKTISFKVNSSTRSVTKAVNFESGKRMLYNVPVKSLGYAVASDAFNITSIGRQTNDNTHLTGNPNNTVIYTNGEKKNIIVNGQSVEAYKLSGSNNNITITGFLPDLIQALPIGFYASTWGSEPAVMTVNSVTAWLPKYSITRTNKTDYWEGTDKMRSYDVTTMFSQLTSRGGAETNSLALVTGGTGNNPHFKLSQTLLNALGDGVASKITFSNISPNGYYDSTFENSNVVVLNDGFANKEINETNINNFLRSFTAKVNGVSRTATYEGLKKAALADPSKLPSSVIYKEIQQFKLLGGGYVTQSVNLQTLWPPTTKDENGEEVHTLDPDIEETIDGIYGKIKDIAIAGITTKTEIPTEYDLLHMLRDVKVSIELVTTSAGPTIVIWGLDGKGDTIIPAPSGTN